MCCRTNSAGLFGTIRAPGVTQNQKTLVEIIRVLVLELHEIWLAKEKH